MKEIVEYYVMAMSAWVPMKAQVESLEETRHRYSNKAEAAMIVAYDPENTPLYPGRWGRLKTGLAFLGIASYEGSFFKKVENGELRGDDGRSWCDMQINLGVGDIPIETPDGTLYWRGEDLAKSQTKCFRAGYEKMKRSFNACRNLPSSERLAAYAAGSCGSTPGRQKSTQRLGRVEKWFSENPFKHSDAVFIEDYCSVYPRYCRGVSSFYEKMANAGLSILEFDLKKSNSFTPLFEPISFYTKESELISFELDPPI